MILFLVFNLFLSTFTNSGSLHKTALIIGVSQYKKHEDSNMVWHDLDTEKDVEMVKAALVSQGFKEQNIIILQNEQATKDNILNTIEKKWVGKAKKGSLCVFHFSGHGQQIFDDNKDEADGLDESIIPFDAYQKYKEGVYEGEKHIRDDELNKSLQKIRKKIGVHGQLLVTLDACHSGTGVRDDATAKVRGSKDIFAPKAFVEGMKKEIVVENIFGLGNDNPSLAKIITISASAAYELNYQTHTEDGYSCGSLSLAFSQAFPKMDARSSYQELFTDIRHLMHYSSPDQSPQLEGEEVLGVLGGKLEGVKPYFNIQDWKNPKEMGVNAGILQGLTVGSEVEIRPRREEKSLAKGKIVWSGTTSCEIQITKGEVSQKQWKKARVFVTRRNHFHRIRLGFGEGVGKSTRSYLRKRLQKDNAFQIVESNVDINITQNDAGLYNIHQAGVPTKKNIQDKNELWKCLKKYHTADFMRKIDAHNPILKAELELIPTKGSWRIHGADTSFVFEKVLPINHIQDLSGCYSLKINNTFQYKISNKGKRRIYYTLISIDSKGNVVIVVPHFKDGSYINQHPNDLYLEPNTHAIYKYDFKAYYPRGTDVLKLISSDQPIDLRHISSKDGNNKMSPHTPFTDLYTKMLHQSPLNKNAYLLPNGDLHIETILVRVFE